MSDVPHMTNLAEILESDRLITLLSQVDRLSEVPVEHRDELAAILIGWRKEERT